METRRKFIKKTAAFSLGGVLTNWALKTYGTDKHGELLPMRKLTRNGEMVTAFTLGGYHAAKSFNDKQIEALIERSIELGVRFFDNARVYHRGVAEEYYGKYLTPKYRDEIFLMTKGIKRSKKEALQELQESLKAMKTDYIDLWTIHTISSFEDVDNRMENGILDAYFEAKEKGLVKNIGFSCHTNPKVALYFLDFLDKRGLQFDTCQCPVNVCDASFESFQNQLLPELLKKEYGIIAMKTMAGGGIIGRRFDLTPNSFADEDIKDITQLAPITFKQLHQFVYSYPVSTLCSGCETVEELEQNIKVLKNLQKMPESEMQSLVKIAEPFAGKYAEHYKRVME